MNITDKAPGFITLGINITAFVAVAAVLLV